MDGTTRRNEVATPALILDVDQLDRNIATMAALARDMGVALRPHAKTHKCVEIARRLVRAGAVGASCATLDEAESMALGGIGGILITSPMTSLRQMRRLHRLLDRGADLGIVADHPSNVEAYAGVAAAAGRVLDVYVDFDFNLGRTGCIELADAVALARAIAQNARLRFRGVQAYWGNLQQIMPLAERVRLAAIQQDRLRQLIAALTATGLSPEIVTGAGTGTHAVDGRSGAFTELQPGSYLLMDSLYGSIVTSEGGNPFAASLSVAATVISENRAGRAIVNAGLKAFATDSGKPVPLRGAPADARYDFMGDEHGVLTFSGDAPALGATIEFLASHCDPTVNLYPVYHVVRGDAVIDVWPIAARYGAGA